jgi:hypothetical protein
MNCAPTCNLILPALYYSVKEPLIKKSRYIQQK